MAMSFESGRYWVHISVPECIFKGPVNRCNANTLSSLLLTTIKLTKPTNSPPQTTQTADVCV